MRCIRNRICVQSTYLQVCTGGHKECANYRHRPHEPLAFHPAGRHALTADEGAGDGLTSSRKYQLGCEHTHTRTHTHSR